TRRAPAAVEGGPAAVLLARIASSPVGEQFEGRARDSFSCPFFIAHSLPSSCRQSLACDLGRAFAGVFILLIFLRGRGIERFSPDGRPILCRHCRNLKLDSYHCL